MRAQAAMLLAGKAYQAGVIRSMLYQRLYDTISVPELSVSIGMQAATDAVTAYLNTIVGSEVIKPLVDASGAHLTNLNSKGSVPSNCQRAEHITRLEALQAGSYSPF